MFGRYSIIMYTISIFLLFVIIMGLPVNDTIKDYLYGSVVISQIPISYFFYTKCLHREIRVNPEEMIRESSTVVSYSRPDEGN